MDCPFLYILRPWGGGKAIFLWSFQFQHDCVEEFFLFDSIYNVLHTKINRSWLMKANVSKGLVKNRDFPILLYKEKWPKMGLKMSRKLSKSVQVSWNLDQTCISRSFIKFQKIFGKFSKFADFWPKNGHLACISRPKIATRFSTENVCSLWKMVQLV